MSKFSKGLKWSGREHFWECFTNKVLLLGIIVTLISLYQFNSYSGIVGFIFLVASGFFHMLARISHKREQTLLKDSRSWKK